MLKLLCAIPENVGWVLVGALGAVAVMLLIVLCKVLRNIWQEWRAYLREEKEDREKLGLD